jgi:transcriptional regulator with GAF, ATPase, and Fis domain/CheY-like chemotaxis protein
MSAGAIPAAHWDNCRVLIASSDPDLLSRSIAKTGNQKVCFEEVPSGAEAMARLRSASFDFLILDRRLPDLNADEVAEIVRKKFPGIQIQFADSLVVSNGESGPSVLNPFANKDISRKAAANDSLPVDLPGLPGMVGQGNAMGRICRLARLVAPRNTPVLITGETGTGKELVARAIHQISLRRDSPLVVVNCAAIPEALLEAELFGHVRGAFTGAVQSRLGRIHNAHGGTLFLDEIGDLPLGMQSKLLRFLQEGEVQRLGSSDVFRVDVRVICATNVNLAQSVKQRAFRQDLYYRISVFPIELPPLRERIEDIAPLAELFLSELCREADVQPKRLSASSMALLRQTHWPGNVRELQHAVERAFILSGSEPHIHVEHFNPTTDIGEISKS